jgi:hypothetical protein
MSIAVVIFFSLFIFLIFTIYDLPFTIYDSSALCSMPFAIHFFNSNHCSLSMSISIKAFFTALPA